MSNVAINYTDAFERWWREHGQFLPPCDTRPEGARKLYKKYAFEMWKSLKQYRPYQQVTV